MKKLISLVTIISLLSLTACGKDDDTAHDWPWDDPEEEQTPEEEGEANPAIVKAGWTNVDDTFGDLPDYLHVYKSPATLQGKNAIAYIAVADLSKGRKFDVLGDIVYCDDKNVANYGATSLNTPAQFYTSSKAPIVVNGGLFFSAKKTDGSAFYVSQSLSARNGKLLSPNQAYYVPDWSNPVYYYPTIGAFCQKADGTCEATWTYTTSEATYCYSSPAENFKDKTPLQRPSATFPTTGVGFSATNAIGGVGVLLKGGTIKNTWAQEMLGVSADSNQPRTAIGYTSDKKLILFVCEGRGMTEGVAGLTTEDEAKVLSSLGCVEALNLDGGGSSCMLINGKETIKPSDGKERSVLTAVRIY